MAKGMFDFFTTPVVDPEEQARHERALRLAQLPYGQRSTYEMDMANQSMASNIGRAAGAAFGVDARSETEKRQTGLNNVKAAIAQAMQNVNRDDPEYMDKFYKVSIDLLNRNGLVGEAAQLQQEWEEYRNKVQGRQIQQGQLERQTREGQERNAVAQARAAASGSEVLQITNAMTALARKLATVDPSDPNYRQLTINYEGLLARLEQLTKGKLQIVNAQDHIELTDPITGNVVRSIPIGVNPSVKAKIDAKAGEGDGTSFAGKGTELGKLGDGRVVYQDKNGNPYFFDAQGNKVPYNESKDGVLLPKETETEAKKRKLGEVATEAGGSIDSGTSVAAWKIKTYFSLDGSPIKQQAFAAATLDDKEMQFIGGVRAWLNAHLRDESGAAVPESEYPKYMDPYIPYAGDSTELLAQKKKRRDVATGALTRGASKEKKNNGEPKAEQPKADAPKKRVKFGDLQK